MAKRTKYLDKWVIWNSGSGGDGDGWMLSLEGGVIRWVQDEREALGFHDERSAERFLAFFRPLSDREAMWVLQPVSRTPSDNDDFARSLGSNKDLPAATIAAAVRPFSA